MESFVEDAAVLGELENVLHTTGPLMSAAKSSSSPGSLVTNVRGTSSPASAAVFSCTGLYSAIATLAGLLTHIASNDARTPPNPSRASAAANTRSRSDSSDGMTKRVGRR